MLSKENFHLERYDVFIHEAIKFMDNFDELKDSFEAHVVKTEFGQASLQHRGFYDPSPVDDILIGNAKRGKLLKRLSPRSKDYIVFCFDEQSRLIIVKKFWNGKQCYTEYLQHQDDQVFGVCVNINGEISEIVHEKYNCHRITCYLKMLYSKSDGLISVDEEYFYYDEHGLEACEVYRIFENPFENGAWVIKQNRYEFKKEDGYLSQYICTTEKSKNVYKVQVDRKA